MTTREQRQTAFDRQPCFARRSELTQDAAVFSFPHEITALLGRLFGAGADGFMCGHQTCRRRGQAGDDRDGRPGADGEGGCLQRCGTVRDSEFSGRPDGRHRPNPDGQPRRSQGWGSQGQRAAARRQHRRRYHRRRSPCGR